MTETIKDRIQQRLDALQISARAASIKATNSDGTIRNILTGKSIDPRLGTLSKIAAVLETSVDWLLYGDAGKSNAPTEPLGSAISEVEYQDLQPRRALDMARSIPIQGTAAGSIIHQVEGFVIEPDVIGYVKRPASLEHVSNAYAILITGDSMYPMHPPGEVRLVNPTRPTAPGDSVILITRTWDDDPGQAYIKILRRRTQKLYIVEQFNPPAILEVPAEYVKACHYVMTYNDVIGY